MLRVVNINSLGNYTNVRKRYALLKYPFHLCPLAGMMKDFL